MSKESILKETAEWLVRFTVEERDSGCGSGGPFDACGLGWNMRADENLQRRLDVRSWVTEQIHALREAVALMPYECVPEWDRAWETLQAAEGPSPPDVLTTHLQSLAGARAERDAKEVHLAIRLFPHPGRIDETTEALIAFRALDVGYRQRLLMGYEWIMKLPDAEMAAALIGADIGKGLQSEIDALIEAVARERRAPQ